MPEAVVMAEPSDEPTPLSLFRVLETFGPLQLDEADDIRGPWSPVQGAHSAKRFVRLSWASLNAAGRLAVGPMPVVVSDRGGEMRVIANGGWHPPPPTPADWKNAPWTRG